MTDIRFDPDFEQNLTAMVIEKMNEAVTAVGPADGRDAAAIAAALDLQLRDRGVELPAEQLDAAAAGGAEFRFEAE